MDAQLLVWDHRGLGRRRRVREPRKLWERRGGGGRVRLLDRSSDERRREREHGSDRARRARREQHERASWHRGRERRSGLRLLGSRGRRERVDPQQLVHRPDGRNRRIGTDGGGSRGQRDRDPLGRGRQRVQRLDGAVEHALSGHGGHRRHRDARWREWWTRIRTRGVLCGAHLRFQRPRHSDWRTRRQFVHPRESRRSRRRQHRVHRGLSARGELTFRYDSDGHQRRCGDRHRQPEELRRRRNRDREHDDADAAHPDEHDLDRDRRPGPQHRQLHGGHDGQHAILDREVRGPVRGEPDGAKLPGGRDLLAEQQHLPRGVARPRGRRRPHRMGPHDAERLGAVAPRHGPRVPAVDDQDPRQCHPRHGFLSRGFVLEQPPFRRHGHEPHREFRHGRRHGAHLVGPSAPDIQEHAHVRHHVHLRRRERDRRPVGDPLVPWRRSGHVDPLCHAGRPQCGRLLLHRLGRRDLRILHDGDRQGRQLASPSVGELALPGCAAPSAASATGQPAEGTADIASYRIEVNDNGAGWALWIASTTATSGSYSGQDGHTYQFRSIATDNAGNVESKSTNDSWTIVDMSPPDSVVTTLPPFENTVQFTVSWGPVGGTTDIATYQVQVREGAGAWVDLACCSSTTSASTSFVGQDGHSYGFRSIARDRAGNIEIAPPGNDTSTTVDIRSPFVTDVAPLGANTNLTPWVIVTFSEPMDRSSVALAFSITPAMNGAYQWSADSTQLTFIPARALNAGTTYAITVDSSAKDRAGNPMTQSRTFQFSTAGGGLTGGFSVGEYWWLLAVVGAVAGGALFMILRRRGSAAKAPPAAAAAEKESNAIVEDVFLLNHRDGVLIKHETRRLRPDVDTDILSGMLTAVQQFVKDALRGDDYADLNEMTVGHMHILIGRGKWLVLAARIEGDGSGSWTARIERCIKDMEDHHWDQLEDWDGDMSLARVLTPYIKKLISGGYDAQ